MNAALDRIDGLMKEDNASNTLRFECLQEEQKRLTNILADDTDRRKQWEEEMFALLKES